MSPRESYALATYGMYLRIVEHMMGHSSTSSEQELRDAGKALFASKFDDVYAFDEFFYQTMYTQKIWPGATIYSGVMRSCEWRAVARCSEEMVRCDGPMCGKHSLG